MEAMASGLRRHGIEVAEFQGKPPLDSDFCVVWGMRKAERCKALGFKGPCLVVERGYIGDRLNVWTSLGWDGLNGHARFNGVWDKDRFTRNFGSDLMPWRDSVGYALILGQVMGDAALLDVDIRRWYNDAAVSLWKSGWDIKFRPHPESERKGHERPRISFATESEGTLAEALAGAGIAVAFNSNSLVDAVMAGVPIHAGDRGSMVYELASRDFDPIRPDREDRLNEIANVQWTMAEICSGAAWDAVRVAM